MSAFSTIVRRYVSISSVIGMLVFADALAARAEVYADDPNPRDPNRAAIMALAADLAPIAKAFGCEFGWGQLSDSSSASLEFVPKGEDVRNWKRLLTITTVALPSDAAGQIQLMNRLQAITLNNFSTRGSAHDLKRGENPKGMPALYFEYEIGEAAQKEYGIAGVYKVRSNMAAIVQIQSHKTLARGDATKMSALAIPASKN